MTLDSQVIVTKQLGQLGVAEGSIYDAMNKGNELQSTKILMGSPNSEEGVKAFKEKRPPHWGPSKL